MKRLRQLLSKYKRQIITGKDAISEGAFDGLVSELDYEGKLAKKKIKRCKFFSIASIITELSLVIVSFEKENLNILIYIVLPLIFLTVFALFRLNKLLQEKLAIRMSRELVHHMEEEKINAILSILLKHL